MTAYYNEIDPFAAQWLRNLIHAGHIAPGDVDERSIVDVHPADVIGYTQCHFFAGIGGWSLAARLAGWFDDRELWTGSCPCQPFSAAGKRRGVDDERHLWPVFFRLIDAIRPRVVMGEQVASKAGLAWFDAVHADLEGSGYAVRAADLCTAGVGAPHIRQRLWWIGALADDHDHDHGREGVALAGLRRAKLHDADGCGAVGLADRERAGLEVERVEHARAERATAERGGAAGVAHTAKQGRSAQQKRADRADGWPASEPGRLRDAGFWDACDWLPCRDGKARPVEPGTFPLAHGVPGRVGRLRAYGNAIVPQVAAEVIRAYLDQ